MNVLFTVSLKTNQMLQNIHDKLVITQITMIITIFRFMSRTFYVHRLCMDGGKVRKILEILGST